MGIKGKLVKQVEIKMGIKFHEIYRYKPHEVSHMSPGTIHVCNLHAGEWGTIGSVISWHYVLDGRASKAKEVIEAIDEEKKLLSFKVVEGDIMAFYESFLVTIQVDTKGENNLVTWTFEYEKLDENIEDPHTVMDALIKVTKDIDAYHLKQTN